MAARITIIIPAFNQLEYCRQCVISLVANTRLPYSLVLVDNGSTDGVGEYFDRVEGASAIHAGRNRGFAGGVNLGLAQAEGHVVVLNSDTLLPRGWLGRLVAALERTPDAGMVGPMTNYASGPQQIDGLDFASLDEISAYADGLAERNQGQLIRTDRLVGFCLLIRDAAFERVGLFDESFGIGNYEDDDYGLRVRRAGYSLCIAQDAFVFHYGNRTFLGMGMTDERWDGLLKENRGRFLEKWNLRPEARADAAQESRRLNGQARQALDAGDAPGAIRLLKEAIEACPGLELNYNDLGAVLWQMEERERAYEHFARAVRLNPAYAEARDNLRDAGRALGREDEAESLLNRPESDA
ncbi:MAG: glycosyltransferase [Candidatus Hydrogenedentes bacterium]|nr:glycosyltransferase [Candidatus Hydrogenedentota bacterium]